MGKPATQAKLMRECLTFEARGDMSVKSIGKEKGMPTKLKISIGEVLVYAELSDTACAQAIAKALPIETRPNVWGDEFYFTIPVSIPLDETATTRVTVGDIGFWPPGNALAIFFGPTPLSSGPDPVPASEVNLAGKIMGDATILRKAKGASVIKLEKQ